MNDKLRQIGEQYITYNLNKWAKKGTFDVLNDISENYTLTKIMDTLGNFNNAIIIVGYWIFDSNYDKALHLTRKSLGLICSPSVGEEQDVNFETVFYAVR